MIREERRQPLIDIRIDQPIDAPLADAQQIRQPDRRIVQREGQRRTMEVAAGKDVADPSSVANISGLSVAEPVSVSITAAA